MVSVAETKPLIDFKAIVDASDSMVFFDLLVCNAGDHTLLRVGTICT